MLRCAGPLLSILCVYVSLAPLSAAEKSTAPRPLPTEAEARILAALAQATAVDFAEQPLSDVIHVLKQKHEIQIQLDTKALTDAGVGTDTPITATLQGVSLRSLLRLMLGQLDLTYVVGDGYLLITSKTEAENMLRVKVYPVRDLVTLDSEFRPPLPDDRRGGEDYGRLINLIQSTVAPTTWDEVGGPGSVQEYRNSHSITFTQTEEVHEEAAELMSALRRIRDEQIAAAQAVHKAEEAQPPAKDEGVQTVVYRLLPWLGPFPWPLYGPMSGMGVGGGMGGAGGGMGGMGGGMYQVADEDAANADTKSNESSPAPSAPAPNAPKTEPKKESPTPTATVNPSWDDRHLDDWAMELARTLPELVEPGSWAADGESSVRVVAGALVIRQKPEVHEKIAEFLGQILPGRVVTSAPIPNQSIRLPIPGVQLDWPQAAQPGAAANEAEIEQALGKKCDVDFSDEPFVDAVKTLAAKGPLRLWIDLKALSDAGVGIDTPITRSVHGVSLRTAFKLLLGELDLTYVIRNEVFLITSKTEAESMLVTKVYPVFDLVATPAHDEPRHTPWPYRMIGNPPGPWQRGGLDFRSLIENIQVNVSVTTWDEVGGAGSIKEFVNSGALVISQTTENHEQITAYIRALREAAVAQQ
jgi:hypothetical protein